MRNLYSITTNQAAIIVLFRVVNSLCRQLARQHGHAAVDDQVIRTVIAIVKPVRKAQSARHFPISLTVVSVSAFMKKMKATTKVVTIATTTARAKCTSRCISSTP
jgi:hypothetical protein